MHAFGAGLSRGLWSSLGCWTTDSHGGFNDVEGEHGSPNTPQGCKRSMWGVQGSLLLEGWSPALLFSRGSRTSSRSLLEPSVVWIVFSGVESFSLVNVSKTP